MSESIYDRENVVIATLTRNDVMGGEAESMLFGITTILKLPGYAVIVRTHYDADGTPDGLDFCAVKEG